MWPSQGTATITTSDSRAASAFAIPRTPAPSSAAAAWARSALREPMITGLPAAASR